MFRENALALGKTVFLQDLKSPSFPGNLKRRIVTSLLARCGLGSSSFFLPVLTFFAYSIAV